MEKQVGTPGGGSGGNVTESPRKSTRARTTLGELGRQLPVGIKNPDGQLVKAFDYRRMKTKDERAIGKAMKAKMTQGQHVSHVLAHMCDRIGHYEFDDKMGTPERITRIGQMYMGDVLFVYMHLRVSVMGPELPLDVRCTNTDCGKEFKFTADLESTEVETVQKEEDLRWKYDLRDPIELRGKHVTSMSITTPRWFATSRIGEDDENIIKLVTVRAGIAGLNDEPEDVMLSDAEIDELSKWDLEGIVSQMDKELVGPDMVVEGHCEKCGASFTWAIPWAYNNFFARSSR